MPRNLSQPKPKKTSKKTKEKIRVAQVVEVSPKSSKGEETPIPGKSGPVFYENDSEGEDDPMVSGTITPLTAQGEVVVPSQSGARGGGFMALLYLGCTQCLISLKTVDLLGLRLKRLKHPMKFEQVDGSLMGWVPATCLTEAVTL